MTSLFLANVLDLKVFDIEGKFVTKLDKAVKGKLVHNNSGDSYFAIEVVDFNIDLIKALGEVNTSESKTDFEKELSSKSTKIRFKPLHHWDNIKKFKLIAEGEFYNGDGEVSHDFKVIINKSELVSGLDFESSNEDLSSYTHVFQIRTDEEGNSFELELFDK